MVERYPGSLTAGDEISMFKPVDIILDHPNIQGLYGVLEYIIQSNPSSLLLDNTYESTPLHNACFNKHMSSEIVKLLVANGPQATRRVDVCGRTPLLILCDEECKLVGKSALDILHVLLKADPGSIEQASEEEDFESLPIHVASSAGKSPVFVKTLINAWPESVKATDAYDFLPIHCACGFGGQLETVKILLEMYPESIALRNGQEFLPIHDAAGRSGKRGAKTIEFLLLNDPKLASEPVESGLKENQGCLPLHLASDVTSVKVLFDAYPEALFKETERGDLPLDFATLRTFGHSFIPARENEDMVVFLQQQMEYACLIKSGIYMKVPDPRGRLALHRALYENACLGAIKLCVKENKDALKVAGKEGNLSLHVDVGCEVSAVNIVKYLGNLNEESFNLCSNGNNSPLHHACKGGNLEVIKYLMKEKGGQRFVAERNTDGLLPIHLLLCATNNHQSQSLYLETSWQLLLTYPETVEI